MIIRKPSRLYQGAAGLQNNLQTASRLTSPQITMLPRRIQSRGGAPGAATIHCKIPTTIRTQARLAGDPNNSAQQAEVISTDSAEHAEVITTNVILRGAESNSEVYMDDHQETIQVVSGNSWFAEQSVDSIETDQSPDNHVDEADQGQQPSMV
jgi:hypothetical protein